MHSQQHHWNYSDDAPNGPRDWPKHFPVGQAQSPINILVDFCDPLYPAGCRGQRTLAPADRLNECNPLHEMLDKKLAFDGARGAADRGHPADSPRQPHQRRDHLNSVGNDETDSVSDADEHHLRSPSTTSSNSNSNDHSHSHSVTPEPRARSPDFASNKNKNHHHHHHNHHRDHLHRPQSVQQNTRVCTTNKKIFLGYPRYLNTVKLSNTGHGWQVDIPGELAAHTLLAGPHLGDREYRLAQFHCHWGATCDSGSEHQVNGRSYSAEIHFVHWNCSQFRSAEEAGRHKHGLAVLGVFVQALEGEQNRNKHLDKILAGLAEVEARPHSSTSVRDCRLDLKKLFPADRWSYATYEGSLTTPPLSECVDWLVFLQPITCSTSQLEQCRRIRCPEGALIKNCRPVQPLNKRTVSIWTHSSGGR